MFKHATACLILAASAYAWLWNTDADLHLYRLWDVKEHVLAFPKAPVSAASPVKEHPAAEAGPLSDRRGTVAPPPLTQSTQWTSDGPAAARLSGARYQSTERRTIETVSFGNGRFRTLVFGNLHGDDAHARLLVDQLAWYVSSHAGEFPQSQVLLVRSPNPDGVARRSRFNSRHVDLNRNFPSSDFRLSLEENSGPFPASEVETQVLLRIIAEFQPHRILHIQTGGFDRPLATYNRQAGQLAETLQAVGGIELHPLGSNGTSGSIESYVTRTLNRECITFVLPRANNERDVWTRDRNAVLTAMMPSRGDNPSPPPNEPVAISGQISRPAKPPSGNGATLIGIVETTGKPHSARTDVASPDTPAANGTNKQPAHANDLPPGYVELPPPG